MDKKAAAPSVGSVHADRDVRRKGRRVKVVKLDRAARKAVCQNVKTGKQTRIGYSVLAERFKSVSR